MALVSCPQCGSKHLRISRVRGFGQRLRSAVGILPFRCRDCDNRFTSAIWSLSSIRYARCPKCYRTELSTWSEQYYHPAWIVVAKLRLGATPYRCEFCRCNFASFRACKERFSWRRRRERAQAAAAAAQAKEIAPRTDAVESISSMQTVRTPDDRFTALPGYNFTPHYLEISGCRMHYVDEGPRDAKPVLMLHGEPSWCYLYRKMIPPVAAAGHRVLAPDLLGFGRSDKPLNRSDYSYQFHVDAIAALLQALDLHDITLFGQDWGGLIGLRVATENSDRFAGIIAANTGLPTGDVPLTDAFFRWQEYSQSVPELHCGGIVKGACKTELSPEVIAAYDAPFPDEAYKAGARAFPLLVPSRPDDPAAPANRKAWEALGQWEKPFLTAFSDSDPVTAGGHKVFQKLVPGAQNQPHVTIAGAGHFLQEDKGEECAQVVIDFLARMK